MKLIKNGTIILIIGLIGFLAVVGVEVYIHGLAEPKSYTSQEIADMHIKLVNINTASAEELTVLPALTAKQAQNIIDYREENGGFRSVEELLDVKGIGKLTYQRIEAYVTLE